MVDEGFQESVRGIFDIDKITCVGAVSFDDDKEESKTKGDGQIKYVRESVKSLERAREKAQNDYEDDAVFPASARVLDFNRCVIIVNDIATLLRAVEVFIKKVEYYQGGNIIGIVRNKNGFIKYVENGARYADIKLNVLIRGENNNIIGEVQFLLNLMNEFKNKVHDLHVIKRKQASIENSVSKILPILLNKDMKLFGIGIEGNVNQLCKLMVFNNMGLHKDLLKKDPKSEKTILHLMTSKDRVKAISWLKSMMTINKFIEYIFQRCEYNVNPIEFAAMYGAAPISKMLLDIPQIKEKYMTDDEELRGLLHHLFGYNKNEELIDYIFENLEISPEKFVKINKMKIKSDRTLFGSDNGGGDGYSKYQYEYASEPILNHSIDVNRVKRLEKWISIIGEKEFAEIIFIRNAANVNGVQKIIIKKDVNMMEFVLNIKPIKQKLCGVEGKEELNKEEITHIFGKLNQHFNDGMAKLIVDQLNLDENKLKELKQYKDFDMTKLVQFVYKE